jgi:hypothetical protein
MLESTRVTLDEADELRLAQLACARLAAMVQGVLSVGLPGLRTGVPESRSFFDQWFRVMNGFALVLHHSDSAKPGGQETTRRLREQSTEVLAALEELRQRLFEYLDSSGETARTLTAARSAVANLCDAIDGYADLIHLDRSRITKVKGVVLQVFDGVESMSAERAPGCECI